MERTWSWWWQKLDFYDAESGREVIRWTKRLSTMTVRCLRSDLSWSDWYLICGIKAWVMAIKIPVIVNSCLSSEIIIEEPHFLNIRNSLQNSGHFFFEAPRVQDAIRTPALWRSWSCLGASLTIRQGSICPFRKSGGTSRLSQIRFPSSQHSFSKMPLSLSTWQSWSKE